MASRQAQQEVGVIRRADTRVQDVVVAGPLPIGPHPPSSEPGQWVVPLQGTGQVREVLPPEFNVRTRYLEYGGLSFHVHRGTVYFVHYADQQLYVCERGATPRQLTREQNTRFADPVFDAARGRLLALRELQTQPESRNSVCTIDIKSGVVADLVQGADFYNSARLDSSGNKLLWISWNHPNMAWNGSELWSADLDAAGFPKEAKKIAGDTDHAVCQARWGMAGDIYYVHEAAEWFNLHVWKNGKSQVLFERAAEFALPDWVPGTQQYAVLRNGSLCAAFIEHGRWRLLVGLPGEEPRLVGEKFAQLPAVAGYQEGVIVLAGRSTRPMALEFIDARGNTSELYSSLSTRLPAAAISIAEEIRFTTADGGTGFAWYYAPVNERFINPSGEKPPLQVRCHGGPTAAAFSDFKKEVQFWTSRGYAVVDVNYGGSTGYGRKYRERLRGNWGIVDVADCVAVVKQLTKEGRIDSARVAIRGGSAGGYTTLAALTFTHGVFAAGASYFGVSELELLAKETHKLESRYLEQLVGPYPAALATYKARAPIEHTDQLNCPIIFFQGDEDKVVPPNQSELMYEALRKAGIPTEYHLYNKEGHGFRRSETLQNSLRAEHAFYARFFGFRVQAEDMAE